MVFVCIARRVLGFVIWLFCSVSRLLLGLFALWVTSCLGFAFVECFVFSCGLGLLV